MSTNINYTDLHLLESTTFAKDYKSQMGILSWDFQCFDLYLAVGRPIGPKPRERSLSTEILPEILLRLFSESHLAVKVASPTEEGPAGWIAFLVHGNQPTALGPHSWRKILETEYTVHRPYHKPPTLFCTFWQIPEIVNCKADHYIAILRAWQAESRTQPGPLFVPPSLRQIPFFAF